jgi:hypothetical protein
VSDETSTPGADAEPSREHPEDPAEGADVSAPDEPRVHSQDPAEGPDDGSAADGS